MDFDIKRLGLGERIVGGSAVLLFIFFFFFNWYSVDVSGLGTFGDSGWHVHTLLRWLVLLTIIGALAQAFMRATNQSVELPVAPGLILAVLAGVTTICIAFRMFIDQPGPDKVVNVDFAAYIGLLCLIAITVGAWLSMGETTAAPASSPSTT